jgi:RNA polymerase sigma-70 factor (ECF subfamily)
MNGYVVVPDVGLRGSFEAAAVIPESISAAKVDQEKTGSRAWEEALPQLMIRYQAGDPWAVEELVSRLSGMLMNFFGAFGLSKADSEDLFQECWIRIHGARHTYRPSEPLLPWIFAIARYTRLDGHRKRRRRESREILVSDPPERPATLAPVGAAAAPDMERMLQGLPESQREVVVLLKVAGMSLEEVARATSSTVGAVKQKAHRAYEKLREILEKERV